MITIIHRMFWMNFYKIIKSLYYGRIDVSEGIDVNKTSASKERDFVTIGIS